MICARATRKSCRPLTAQKCESSTFCFHNESAIVQTQKCKSYKFCIKNESGLCQTHNETALANVIGKMEMSECGGFNFFKPHSDW